MTSGTYTEQELQHHADMIIYGLHSGASANCCAVKTLVMDHDWAQREKFVELIKAKWQKLELPVAYYPGSRERWTAYQQAYPNATFWDGQEGTDRQLSPPMMNAAKGDTKATLLPLLCVEVDANIFTEEGRAAAAKEYAFQKEPFCPVLTLVTLPSKDYLKSATMLCNDFVYGSLSCSLSVPSSKDNDPAVESAVADLKYGTVGVNIWTGMCYAFGWGGHPEQETLENVQSGLGRACNHLFIPHVHKTVVRAPSIWKDHLKTNPDYEQAKQEMEAIVAFVRSPGLKTFISLLAATITIPPAVRWGAMAVAVAAFSVVVHAKSR